MSKRRGSGIGDWTLLPALAAASMLLASCELVLDLPDPHDECWLDPTTGLEWEATPGERLDWYAGVAHCEGRVLCGKDDWALPTIGELRTIIRGCAYTETAGDCPVVDGYTGTDWCSGCSALEGPGPGGCYWPASLGGPCSWYWSSSSCAGGASYAWGVPFNVGGVFGNGKTGTYYVRCVRRGP